MANLLDVAKEKGLISEDSKQNKLLIKKESSKNEKEIPYTLRRLNVENKLQADYKDIFKSKEKNVEKTQRKRRGNGEVTERKRRENVEVTERKRRENVEVTERKRRDKGGDNVEITERKRRDKGGDNVEIKSLNPTLLVGAQKTVFIYLVDLVRQHSSLVTLPLTLDFMSQAIGLKKRQIHTATKELRRKGCVVIVNRKDGRGGWVSYGITQEAFNEWVCLNNMHKRRDNVEITERKRRDKGGDKGGYLVPSSSSSDLLINKNKTTTTTLDESLGVQIPINLKKIGFCMPHVHQVLNSENLTTQEIQESLDAFAYDLEHGKIKSKTGNLNFLMGILLKHGAYTSELLIEQSQKDLENYLKRSREFEKSKETLKEMEAEKKFYSWLEALSTEERNKLAIPTNLIKEGSSYQDVMLKNYWEKHVMESEI